MNDRMNINFGIAGSLSGHEIIPKNRNVGRQMLRQLSKEGYSAVLLAEDEEDFRIVIGEYLKPPKTLENGFFEEGSELSARLRRELQKSAYSFLKKNPVDATGM